MNILNEMRRAAREYFKSWRAALIGGLVLAIIGVTYPVFSQPSLHLSLDFPGADPEYADFIVQAIFTTTGKLVCFTDYLDYAELKPRLVISE